MQYGNINQMTTKLAASTHFIVKKVLKKTTSLWLLVNFCFVM